MSFESKELLSAIKWEGSADKRAVLKVVGAYFSRSKYDFCTPRWLSKKSSHEFLRVA
jgi:hypothetical protein